MELTYLIKVDTTEAHVLLHALEYIMFFIENNLVVYSDLLSYLLAVSNLKANYPFVRKVMGK